VFIVVSLYFVIDSVRKLLDTPSYCILILFGVFRHFSDWLTFLLFRFFCSCLFKDIHRQINTILILCIAAPCSAFQAHWTSLCIVILIEVPQRSAVIGLLCNVYLSTAEITSIEWDERMSSYSRRGYSDLYQNLWSYTSTSQYTFMAWCLVKHRDNFTFYLLSRFNPVSPGADVKVPIVMIFTTGFYVGGDMWLPKWVVYSSCVTNAWQYIISIKYKSYQKTQMEVTFLNELDILCCIFIFCMLSQKSLILIFEFHVKWGL